MNRLAADYVDIYGMTCFYCGRTLGGDDLESPPISVRALRPELPQLAADVIGRALSRRPEERFPSITSFASALSQAIVSSESSSRSSHS